MAQREALDSVAALCSGACDNDAVELFNGCWARLDRADEHRRAMMEIWNSYLDDHPYDFTFEHEGDGVHILRVWANYPIPAEFSVRLGEWLYNLRSCLDYIIWATVAHVSGQVPPPGEKDLQYPIYMSAEAWQRNEFRLKGLAEHHREMLLQMQPFNSDPEANYLGVLNNLARIDRHRRLSDATAYLRDLEPVIQMRVGTEAKLQFGQRVLSEGAADAARVSFSPWTPDMPVSINPGIMIDPEVGDWARSEFWRRWRFSDRIEMIQIFVGGEVAIYEYDCTGSTRELDLLTESYRAACDARPTYGPVRRIDEAWEWGPPIVGSPSTVDRYQGKDFPSRLDEFNNGDPDR